MASTIVARVGVRREEDRAEVGVEAARLRDELHPRHPRHALVGDEEVHLRAREDPERLVAAAAVSAS